MNQNISVKKRKEIENVNLERISDKQDRRHCYFFLMILKFLPLRQITQKQKKKQLLCLQRTVFVLRQPPLLPPLCLHASVIVSFGSSRSWSRSCAEANTINDSLAEYKDSFIRVIPLSPAAQCSGRGNIDLSRPLFLLCKFNHKEMNTKGHFYA